MLNLRRAMAALVLPALVGWASAGEVSNQQLADQLANRYRTSGKLKEYSVNIETVDGVVTLSGKVANTAQRAALEAMTLGQTGVVKVVNEVEVDKEVIPVANFEPARLHNVADQAPVTEGAENAQPVVEPAPAVNFSGGVAPYSDSPVLPPYAWPAYTPYNNYASMAYQTQYPSGAWPFIGPPHPYPMIPSGWRRVTLKWKKGYWWLKFHGH